jgi:hypothetical protein
LENEIVSELDVKRKKCGLSRTDYIRVLILKSTIEVEEIQTEDVIGLDEMKKSKRFMKVDGVNYTKAMESYKLKHRLWKYEKELDFLKGVNKLYLIEKLKRQIQELRIPKNPNILLSIEKINERINARNI